jgi:hypothetical protein
MSNPYDQKPIRLWSASVGRDGVAISGPADRVPPQIRPGSRCRRETCPNNEDGTCAADPDAGARGSLAPFRPLCPRPEGSA